jgi:type II secretory pathway component PulF
LVVNFEVLDKLFLPSVTLILLGLALRVSLRLLYGARGPSPDDAIHLMTRILSWGLLIIPSAVLFVMSINWLSLLMLAAIIEAVTEVMFARRAIQRQAAWDLLLASRAGNRPLSESLQFHQARFTGIVGRWYRRLAADLQQGAPWTDAVWNNRRALPREAAAYARFYQNATPAEAAAGEADERRDMGMLQLRQSVAQQLAYLATIVAMGIAVLAFTGIKIIPSYQSILADFSMPTPLATQELIRFFDVVGNGVNGVNVPLIALGLSAAILVAGVINVFYLCDRPILQPLTDRFGFARHQAQVLRLLALAVGQKIPINDALAYLESGRGGYSSGVVRRRIAAASRRIARGAEWQTALQDSSLINARDAATLRTAQEVGNLQWAMRLLADRKLTLLATRWTVWFQVLFTAAMLLLALFVLWFSVAMFAPITEMIWELA